MGLMAQVQKEVITGADYANDVYYSLENGTVTTVQRDNWDIAFVAQVMSVSVLANNGSGVEVYTWPYGTIDDWDSVDSASIDWTAMQDSLLYNSIETFDMGAFNANTIPGDPLDYGWGRYNMATHVITGDSLFVVKTVSGAYKKLAIIEKNPTTNAWLFKFANLDGTGELTIPFNLSAQTDKYFIHFSLDSMKVQPREPDMVDWDLLFTRYYDYTIPYYVTGVLINDDHVLAQEVRESGMDQATYNTFADSSFTDTISVIGSDWKHFNGASYDLIDTVVYYLKTYGETDSSYYKIYFTAFSGSTEGKYTFMQEKLTLTSVPGTEEEQLLQVYPNPATDLIHVVFDQNGPTDINLIDMTGRVIHSTRYQGAGFTDYSLDISSLNPGIYFVQVGTGMNSKVLRFIKE
jgi:hypothetical protein